MDARQAKMREMCSNPIAAPPDNPYAPHSAQGFDPFRPHSAKVEAGFPLSFPLSPLLTV